MSRNFAGRWQAILHDGDWWQVASILAVTLFVGGIVFAAFWLAHSANEHMHRPSSSSKKANDKTRESSDRDE